MILKTYKLIIITLISFSISISCDGQKGLAELRNEIKSTPSAYPNDSISAPFSDTVKYFSAAYGYEYTGFDQIDVYDYKAIRGFKNLRYLEVGFLEGDPGVLCDYPNLVYLHILDTGFCYLPCLSQLSTLKELHFDLGRNCNFPQFVFENSNLLSLSFNLKNSEQLPEISSLRKFKRFEELSVDLSNLGESDQKNLISFLDGLHELSGLHDLALGLPQNFKQLPIGFGEFKMLKTLSINGDIFSSQKNLEIISQISSLDTLKYYEPLDVAMIDDRFKRLSALKFFYFRSTDFDNYREVRDKLRNYLPTTTIGRSVKN